MPQIGQPAPDFTLPRAGGGEISLEDLRGSYVVLYFYPRDDTPGCTREAQDFTALMPDFRGLGAEVLGVSRDSLRRHEGFRDKHALAVTLLSDEDNNACQAYETWVEKRLYGRVSMGIERATFLIGPDGRVLRIWRKVKVAGHAAEVLAALKSAAMGA